MILAPATMTAEKDPKEAARKCLEEVGLDPESYRIGHTKARNRKKIYWIWHDLDYQNFDETLKNRVVFYPSNYTCTLFRFF